MWSPGNDQVIGWSVHYRDDSQDIRGSAEWPPDLANGRIRTHSIFARNQPSDRRAKESERIVLGNGAPDPGYTFLLLLVHLRFDTHTTAAEGDSCTEPGKAWTLRKGG